MRWNNTLSVINNPANNGGYSFVSYRWFRDGQIFSTAQWWSAGAQGESLDTAHTYQVEAVTTDGKTLLTCPAHIILRSANVIGYPNPVGSGQLLYIEADLDDALLRGAVIEVYNPAGTRVDILKVQGRLTPVDIRYSAGSYIFVLKSADGLTKELRIIVK
jgi:hypothetical protein